MERSNTTRPTRRQYIGATGAAMLAGLAGCLGDDDDDDGDLDIELYTWNLGWLDDDINGWRSDFEDEFGDEYDNLSTSWVDRGPSTEDILAFFEGRIQAGSPPNIFDTQTTAYARYAEEGLFADPEEFENNEFLNRFSDASLDLFRMNGQLQQIPFYLDTSWTCCNTEFFDDAGIEPPTLDNPWSTWDYLDATEEVVDNSDATYGLTHIRFDYNFWPYWHAEGVDILTDDNSEAAFNTQTTVDILDRFQELTEGGYIPEVAWTGGWQPPAEQFGARNTGMYFGSGSALRLVAEVFGDDWVSPDTVYVGPPPEGGEMYMSYHGFGIVDTDDVSDTELEASLDFTSVATNQKWQEAFLRGTTVLVPNEDAVDAVRNDDDFADDNPLLMQLYDQFAALEDDLDAPPTVPASPTIAEIIDTEFSSAALGESSAQEAVDTAEERVNNALN